MKLESVRIENFRSYKDQLINLDDYTCFVGPNGAGKSTVFYALNIFFRQYKDSTTDLSKLSADDFHHKDITRDIKITVTFTDLSDRAKEDLKDYVRQNKLVVTAVAKFDAVTETAEVKQFGSRLGIEEFRSFFEADKEQKKVAELKEIYSNYQSKYTDLKKVTSKADMIESLRDFELSHPELCSLISSEDEFYGVTRGTNRLAPHVQWIFVPAVKDVAEEGEESKTSALGQLLARTVRSKISFDEKINQVRIEARKQYQALLNAEQSALDGISASLQKRLTAWAHPNLSAKVLWKQDLDKSVKVEEPAAFIKVGERGFEADLARFGHGLQRSYMLALLQELASSEDANGPTLIMGIEEPELYQHPPQARYLAETLIELCGKDAQILICTHNPLFIPGDNFNKIRIVRECGNPSYTTVTSLTYDDLSKEVEFLDGRHLQEVGMIAKLYSSLNPIINEMFFCRVLFLVEGLEDVAYITSYLMLSEKITEFRKYGCHIVPVEGKNKLVKPLAVAKLLGIPAKVIFDADTNKTKADQIIEHRKDNKALLSLQGYGSENEWPTEHIFKENLTCWHTNLTDVIKNELGADWQIFRDEAEVFFDCAGNLEKNPLAIAKTLELAWLAGKKSQFLLDLINRIIRFAEKSTNS